MRSAADIANELDEGLKQLFDAGLALSLQVQANAMAAEPEEQAKLALTFHRLSRGVRQTAALRMRLAREAERAGREASAEVIQLAERRLQKRKARVKAGVESLIWVEAEDDDSHEGFETGLEELLDIESQDPETFEAEDLDEQVARFAQKLGLSLARPVHGAGGPSAEEPMVGGAGSAGAPAGPSTTPSAGRGPPPPRSGEADQDDDPLFSDDYWRRSSA